MELSVLVNSVAVVVFLILCTITVGASKEGDIVGELTYCGPNNKSTNEKRRDLVIVSTLDGRLSALNAANDGSLEWSVDTGPGPMLSSSIHRLELTNNGHWVRMIPSLTGGLYKFDGDNIEAIPISADSLLHASSFLFSDDLVISGGKESRTYGVELETGHVLYECSMAGCDSVDENISADQDMLVVHRKTQTVRAVEVRTGVERWNFSVGQHDLKLMTDYNSDCHDRTPDAQDALNKFEFNVKAIVPEGLVCAVSKSDSKSIVWKHKFTSPIVTAWHLHNGKMQAIDLFSGSQWSPQYNSDDLGPVSPSLYIGMHNKQLYIQESVDMERTVKQAFNLVTDETRNNPRIPWVPFQASSAGLGLITAAAEQESSELISLEDTRSTTSISVLYASEYVNGNGYYLFSEKARTAQCSTNVTNNTIEGGDQIEDEFEMPEEGTPVEIIIGSLWHWWKEVLIISITTAALVNLIIKRDLFQAGLSREVIRKEIVIVEKEVPMKQVLHDGNHELARSNSEPVQVPAPEFTSRYLTDFEQVHCLGKGGFGVVFEAKNKIDECHYAVKRIALPNKQESRDRVLREVKALAKLEHSNIVRFFNAWLEFPPAGWVEEQDKLLQNSSVDAISINIPGQSNTLSKSSKPLAGDSSVGGTDASESRANNSCQTFANKPSLQMLHFNDDFTSSLPNNHSFNDQSDSFIVFESTEHEPEEDANASVNRVEDSVISVDSTTSESALKSVSEWEAERIEKTNNCVVKKRGHKRPGSLDFSQSAAFTFAQPPTRVYLFIQMQLCRKASLREWLVENSEQRTTAEVLPIFQQIVNAVEYVHLQGLIHRDLKPSNIFFSQDGQIKIGDFGLVTAMVEGSDVQRTPSTDSSNFRSDKHTDQVGTQLYMSPEQLMGQPYNYKVDIYSLGIILFELLVPFKTHMERGYTLTNLRQNKFPTHFQNEFLQEFQLLQLMLSHQPEERPTTLGIRAKPPLCTDTNSLQVDEQWHFELPHRSRESSRTSLSNSSSVDSSSWEKVS